jgi:hypothetical protein
MSDGITVAACDDGTIVIVTTVGEKTARVRVTPDYARNLAARLMMAAHEPEQDAKGRYVDA